jgi:RND family efflux transporter MFP subunit
MSRKQGLALGLTALGLACLAIPSCRRNAGSDPSAVVSAPVRVGAEDVAAVRREPIAEGPSLSGTLGARREATVRAEIPGKVVAIHADEGQAVRRGARLARIDPGALGTQQRSAQTGVTSARNALATAQRQASRQEELAREGIVSRQDLEEARLAVANARAALADAQAQASSASEQLGRAEVTSPIEGVVSERGVSAGDVVQVGTLLFTVVDNSFLQLDAAIPAADLAAVKVGQPVTFVVSGFESRPITGRISRINPTADPTTRQIQVFVDIPNADRSLVGGLYAEGRVLTSAARVGLVVPTAAVDRSAAQPFVVRLDGSRVTRVPVTIGVVDEKSDRAEVRGALKEGDRVLLGAARLLTPGTVVEAPGAAPAAPPPAASAP